MSVLPQALEIETLTAAAFAPFGELIAPEAAQQVFSINAGTCTRFHDLGVVACESEGGRAGISLFRAAPRTLPLAITLLERHPLGSQAFIPQSQAPYLVVVAQSPQTRPRAFLARAGQGINLRRGTWHHPLLALEATSDFVVIDRIGPGRNCDEVVLAQAFVLGACRTLDDLADTRAPS